MTALTLRVWWTATDWARDGWVLAGAAVCAVLAAALLTLAVADITVIPVVDAALVALLPLCAAGSAATTLLQPSRRPVRESRAASPRRDAPAAPGARRTRPVRGVQGGCAHMRPAAVSPRTPAAAGPYRVGRAPVPARGAA